MVTVVGMIWRMLLYGEMASERGWINGKGKREVMIVAAVGEGGGGVNGDGGQKREKQRLCSGVGHGGGAGACLKTAHHHRIRVVFLHLMKLNNDFNPILPAVPNNPTPQIIIQQDNSVFPTSIILNETNYPLWSQLMEMCIGARNKAGYLTRETKNPAPEDPSHATRITENHRVKSWLIDSMSQSLMQQFIRLSIAKEIWEAVSKTFYDGSDEARLFELNQKSFSTTQNGRSLSTYYNELIAIFQEIDHKTTSQERTVEWVDILTWKILGYGVKRGKLYYLELTENGEHNFSHAYQTKSEEKARIDDYLVAEFEMKDLGQLKYILGIEITRSIRRISLSQQKYVLVLLTETGMLACKPVETPIKMNHRLETFQIKLQQTKVILLPGRARNKKLWHDQVQKLNSEIWLMELIEEEKFEFIQHPKIHHAQQNLNWNAYNDKLCPSDEFKDGEYNVAKCMRAVAKLSPRVKEPSKSGARAVKSLSSPARKPADLVEGSDPEVFCTDIGDFEFTLRDPVNIFPADQLFSDGKLMPLYLSMIWLAERTMASSQISSPDTPKSRRRMIISGSDPYLFLLKAPRCSSR
ncbi:hypothetical protein RJ639_044732 [Escallonia herrerae]|uniref:Retrotransposon Copia-like N-terminal domain-containing protein n=1 Tax=Escallonia herrerae TaxID=1293975 RepID=A0AA89AZT4_9ASTE|nr:hypothetical protein RJ639_044732 [Escallonia herrerae]